MEETKNGYVVILLLHLGSVKFKKLELIDKVQFLELQV